MKNIQQNYESVDIGANEIKKIKIHFAMIQKKKKKRVTTCYYLKVVHAYTHKLVYYLYTLVRDLDPFSFSFLSRLFFTYFFFLYDWRRTPTIAISFVNQT